MLYVKSYKEWSWKFVIGFRFFNWWHLLICMIFLVLINCILEIQNSWDRQNGKEFHVSLESPKALSDDNSFQVCTCIAEDHLPGGQEVWPQSQALALGSPFLHVWWVQGRGRHLGVDAWWGDSQCLDTLWWVSPHSWAHKMCLITPVIPVLLLQQPGTKYL